MRKRIISILLICFLLPVAVSAEFAIGKQISAIQTENELLYSIVLRANIGERNAGKPVFCQVICTEKEFEDITDDDVIYLDQAVADKNGDVSFSFRMDSYGKFKVRFTVKDGEMAYEEFELISKEEFEAFLKELMQSGKTAQEIVDLINVYSQKINFDTTYFHKLEDQTSIVPYLQTNKDKINIYNIKQYFEESVLFSYLYTAKDLKDIQQMLSDYEEPYLHLSNQEYQNIYSTYQKMTVSEKGQVIQKLQRKKYANTETLKNDFNQSVICTAVEIYGKNALNQVILDNSDLLKWDGYEKLSDTEKSKFLGELKSASTLQTLEEFRNFYLKWLSDQEKPTPTKGPSGGGNSGGGSPVDVNPGIVTDPPLPTVDMNTSFIDLEGVEWAQTAINELAKREIIAGKEPRKFFPNDPITREEFIKLVVGAFSLYDESAVCEFDDVTQGDWFYPYVASGKKSGIVVGISEQLYGVGRQVSREDMATILHRLLVKLNRMDRIDNMPLEFNDMQDVSDYAERSVRIMYNAGLIQGDGGRFYPKQIATRAEAAQMIYNILLKKGEESK